MTEEMAAVAFEVEYFRMKSEQADELDRPNDAEHWCDKMLDAMVRRDAMRG